MKILDKKKTRKRKVEVVISDVYLGTYGCHARELPDYLKSIKPKKIILNGDLMDIWQFRKSFWPASHLRLLSHILPCLFAAAVARKHHADPRERPRPFSRLILNPGLFIRQQ
jgi:hypothetical protein